MRQRIEMLEEQEEERLLSHREEMCRKQDSKTVKIHKSCQGTMIYTQYALGGTVPIDNSLHGQRVRAYMVCMYLNHYSECNLFFLEDDFVMTSLFPNSVTLRFLMLLQAIQLNDRVLLQCKVSANCGENVRLTCVCLRFST